MCITHWYKHFFRGRVRLLEGRFVDGIVEFSFVTSEFSILEKCACWMCDYEISVLLVSSHLYLAELFDNCGCTDLAKDSRAQALSELQDQFFKPFEPAERSREQELGPLMSAWSAGTLDDIIACTGQTGTKWKRFPFEARWKIWKDDDDIDILRSMVKL